MKKNDITALHQLSIPELIKKLEEITKSFDQSRSEHAAGKLKNTRSLYLFKKDIARVKSIIREKTLLAEVQVAMKDGE